jgi:adenosylcobinamide kinase/adenosylcobinamide-phosphate guanylyltransferase
MEPEGRRDIMGIKLITGGVRSGKSRFAESLCMDAEYVTYVATGVASDEEMKKRIEHHRKRRPDHWCVVEEPHRLARVIQTVPPHHLVLVDSLTAWVSNQLMLYKEEWEEHLKQDARDWLETLKPYEAVLVTDEVGLGGVAMHPVSRAFQDGLGWLNQEVAQVADEVWMVIAGIPWRVKP